MLLFVLALLVSVPETPTPPLSWPIEGRITSGYGPRWGQPHDGIDISAQKGKWVRAADSGLVVFAGDYGNYGNLVAIRHKDGVVTYYAHLKNMCVFRLQRIKQGQRIGRIGMTGRTTGPHLHFEVRVHKHAKNPLAYLPVRPVETGKKSQAIGGP